MGGVSISKNIIANQEKLGTSRLDLWLFQILYLLSFKKSTMLKRHIIQIRKDIKNKIHENFY